MNRIKALFNGKLTVNRIIIVLVIALITIVGIITVKALKKDTSIEYTEKEHVSAPMSDVTYSAVPSTVKKSEMVYVNLDSTGKVQKTVVSDKIQTDIKECVVSDISSLKDIYAVSSNINRSINGQNILWHMNSNEFIYNGTSEKQLPVTIAITYFLDGKEISIDKLKGKAGSVTVNIKLINNEARTVSVNGKSINAYSPFVVAGGMILSAGDYSSVAVNSGKVVSDSTKDIVVMVGFPGLNESLALDSLNMQNLNFADEFNVTMYTNNFQADNFYFAVLPLSVIDMEFALPDSIGNAMEGISKLTQIQASLSSIDIDSLMKIFSSESTDNLNSLLLAVTDAMSMYDENAALLELMQKYMTEENLAQFKSFYAALDEANISDNLALIKSMASLLGAANLVTEYEKIQPLLDSLSQDLSNPEVQAALDNLPETIETLNSLKSVLDENSETIAAMAEFMNSDSFTSLMQIMSVYNENKDLFTALTSTAGSLEGIVPYLEAWFNLAGDYTLYTEAAQNTETNVMFIYKTEELGKAEGVTQ